MIYVVWSVVICFCFLYVALFYAAPRFVKFQKAKHPTKEKQKINVAYIEELLKFGDVSPYCSHKDVELLKRIGLFKTLPIIKLFSPSEEEMTECVRLQKKYEFTVFAVDYEFDKKQFGKNFVFVSTSETSPQILFALNRLKLVPSQQKNCSPLPKGCYKKSVCQGLKYVFDPKEKLDEKEYSIVEYLPTKKEQFFVVRNKGCEFEIENIFDGNCFYVWSNKKIDLKYEKIMQKLIFNISKNQINNNLIIYLSNKKINNFNIYEQKSNISWSTTDEGLNKKINLAFEACEEAYYKKFNFVSSPNAQKEFSSVDEFVLFLRSGEIDSISARNVFVQDFLGIKIFGDRVNFSKPKLNLDFVLTVEHDNKKYLITRKLTNSNICEICIDGVCYRNFTSFCFHGIEKPEIFVEY